MSAEVLIANDAAGSLPLWLLSDVELPRWLAEQPDSVSGWVRANGFQAEKSRVLMLPAAGGGVAGAIVGLGSSGSLADLRLWQAAGLADRLLPHKYHLASVLPPSAATQFVLGWLVGAYRFSRYRTASSAARASLVAPSGADVVYAEAAASATAFARDLINTPANDMGPAELAQAATDLATRFGARIDVLVGAALKAAKYPLIHAVGAGSPREPRLIDLRWGKPGGQRVTLVGKGVCFDSGGLDIKPASGMLLMKKDMGGAACVLGLAQLLMQLEAPIQLRVLIPAVENSVDGHAYRPGDVIASRKGITVEIGNTDAEGRLVLADALTEADAEKPDLLI
ncbi:MAG TPA: leucyl aminopeptidase family protein, partial [Steroidobacteraceae bacterium]|nr:leucyl aminopeptidase family protein [Steroidobacteraceae bacterium]